MSTEFTASVGISLTIIVCCALAAAIGSGLYAIALGWLQ